MQVDLTRTRTRRHTVEILLLFSGPPAHVGSQNNGVTSQAPQAHFECSSCGEEKAFLPCCFCTQLGTYSGRQPRTSPVCSSCKHGKMRAFLDTFYLVSSTVLSISISDKYLGLHELDPAVSEQPSRSPPSLLTDPGFTHLLQSSCILLKKPKLSPECDSFSVKGIHANSLALTNKWFRNGHHMKCWPWEHKGGIQEAHFAHKKKPM